MAASLITLSLSPQAYHFGEQALWPAVVIFGFVWFRTEGKVLLLELGNLIARTKSLKVDSSGGEIVATPPEAFAASDKGDDKEVAKSA